MPDYKKIVEELKSKGIAPKFGEFYDYEGLLLDQEFENFFQFCQTYLDRDDKDFDISPARIFFNTNTSKNACAKLSKDYYQIEVFKGIIFHLFAFFREKRETLNEDKFKQYYDLLKPFGIEVWYFLFQYICLFFFYHEVGHLLQRTPDSPDHLEFIEGPALGSSVKETHMREHDADWFSAGQIAFHLLQLVNKKEDPKNPDIDPSALSLIIELALAGIFCFFIDQDDGSPALYFEERSHPHSAVRASYVLMYMIESIQYNLQDKLDFKSILTNAIGIAEQLYSQKDKNIVREFSRGIYDRSGEIQDYINKIRQNSDGYPHLARKKIKVDIEK